MKVMLKNKPKKITKKRYVELMELADNEIWEWRKFKEVVNKQFSSKF